MKKILVLATFLFLSIISFVTFADINNSNVLVTSVKFTATLTASLITGNKVKIDYGKGLIAMTCVDKTCTLSSKSLPSSLGKSSGTGTLAAVAAVSSAATGGRFTVR